MSTQQDEHEAVKAELYGELESACAHLLDNWRENQNLTVPVQNIARTMDAINLWNGPRLCNVAPESCWIDNDTGEHIDANTGARTKEHPAEKPRPRRILKPETELMLSGKAYGFAHICDQCGKPWQDAQRPHRCDE